VSDSKIRRNLNLARKASKFSNFNQHQLGCVLTYGKSILGVGYNLNLTHPTQMKYNQMRQLNGHDIQHKIHAEVKAIMSAQHYDVDWRKVTVYIYREHQNGVPALACPCLACMQLIKDMGIRRIIYTNENLMGYTIKNIS
jgi:deoxycytidylate deaminase